MHKFLLIISFIAYCECAAYSGTGLSLSSSGGSSGSYGGSGGGYGGSGGSSYGVGGGGIAGFGGTPVQAAVETHRTVEVRPVQIPSEPAQPQIIEVPSDDLPVTVHFKSQSSRVFVQQTHIPGVVGETEHTSSEDEPHRVVHEVVKPVIQEVREIIQPYRRLVQQIQPVIEQTHTVIAKGEPRISAQPILAQQVSSLGGGGGGGFSYGGGAGGGASYGSSISHSGGGSSSYSSRSGSLSSLDLGTSAKGGQIVTIGGGGKARVKYADASGTGSVGGSYKSAAASSRARA